jgi:hypothetical protein
LKIVALIILIKDMESSGIATEQCIEDNHLTQADYSHEELDPPPYSPSLPPPYSPPSPLGVQIGKECILSVGGGTVTVVGGKVRIRPRQENSLSQKWKVECASSRIGFRSQLSGRLLGVHKFSGNFVASNKKLKHWQLFCLDAIADGFVFRIPAYLMWIEVYLTHPYLTDYLQASGRRDCTTIVYIYYTNQ